MRKINKWKPSAKKFLDIFTVTIMVAGFLAMIALVYFQVKPIRLADIKVPIATDKASYYPEQQIGGIFFGSVYYNGEVRILREVFCKDYRGVIKPPAESAIGDFFSTQSTKRTLEGANVTIGTLPSDVPIGSNCVIQFTNVYEINTPFGMRREEYQYYTQNFSIISKQERQERDIRYEKDNQIQQQKQDVTTNTTTNNTTTVNQSEPVTPPAQCKIKVLGINALCE